MVDPVAFQAELLNCAYFHVVFTVPEEIAAIAYQNKATVYNILFAATAGTLRVASPPPTRSISAPKSAFSPSYIPGGKL